MHIAKLMAQKDNHLRDYPIPTIAFLGDSVTQGCFELYVKSEGGVETIFDRENAFCSHVERILALLYPCVTTNIINAGISGDSAPRGLARLERDVLSRRPDLTVVSYGLNDSGAGLGGITRYTDALHEIFNRLHNAGSEVIFMTPNMMNTRLADRLIQPEGLRIAERTMKTQNDGILAAYLDAAKVTATDCSVTVCDVYRKWQRLADAGVDTTCLLANYINHPTREMNYLSAYSLVECMLGIV